MSNIRVGRAVCTILVVVLSLGAGPARAATQVAAGGSHTCAVTNAGGARCWGDNGYGQLGDGTHTPRLTAVDVSGLTSGVATVVTGGAHTCVLTVAGGVQCWGDNSAGQLGDGTTQSQATRIDVVGLTGGVTALAAGDSHTCALTAAGGVKCWGSNAFGQLGDGTTQSHPTAIDVSGLTSGVVALGAGSGHTCAVTSTGGVECWGDNRNGQLGDGTTQARLSAVAVSGIASGGVAVVAGAEHTCARTSAGAVTCWGDNSKGQLGDGTQTPRPTAAGVSGLTSGATDVAAGTDHTCALTSAGGVECWGANYYGQLGDGTTAFHLTAVDVSGLASGVTAIAAGSYHTCALTSTGGLKCWGYNAFGQLGDGTTTTPRLTAVDVSGLASGVAAVTAGNAHTCALMGTGGVKCWGYNGSGQLGDGTTAPHPTATDVSGLTSDVTALVAGDLHSCALTSAGGVMCWGDNSSGQLGDGTTTPRLTVTDVSGLTSGVTAIAAGSYHTCALTGTGGVMCWGDNTFGQLGDGTTTPRLTATDVSGLTSGVTAIAAGSYHTCAAMSAGGVKCWGYNGNGQLGDGTTTTPRLTAVDAVGVADGVAALSAGSYHTCALTSAGGVKSWGDNGSGQLGDGTQIPRLTAVDVSGLASGVAALAAGDLHTCALTSAGGVKAWGNNGDGELGNGEGSFAVTPTAALGVDCGNGVLDPGEECDDGNRVSGDCCSATCQAETNGNPCTDDGSVCTTDVCQDGACQHPAGNAGVVCRESTGLCDVAETCTGVDAACPLDVFVDCDNPDPGCACQVFGEDPGSIVFRSVRPDHDFFRVHGRMVLTDLQSLDGKFGILLSNANGEIYKAVLEPGDLLSKGASRLFVDKSSAVGPGTRRGLYKVKIRNRGAYVTVEVKAYSNLRAATLPLMSVQAVIGNENAYYKSEWLERPNGWKLNLPSK